MVKIGRDRVGVRFRVRVKTRIRIRIRVGIMARVRVRVTELASLVYSPLYFHWSSATQRPDTPIAPRRVF